MDESNNIRGKLRPPSVLAFTSTPWLIDLIPLNVLSLTFLFWILAISVEKDPTTSFFHSYFSFCFSFSHQEPCCLPYLLVLNQSVKSSSLFCIGKGALFPNQRKHHFL